MGKAKIFKKEWLIVGVIILTMKSIASPASTVRGVVTDSLTSKTLVGANVFLVGTALGSATDIEGNYRIESVPAGNYILRVTYIGYKNKEYNVVVPEDGTVIQDVKLSPDVIRGQEVIVRGQAIGQAAAINQQITSATIINVVSEEKIQELPDANAAEAIGRLPGVSVLRSGGEANKVVLRGLSDKYSAITIDGVRIASTDVDARGVDLSVISQGSLAGIELHKALTSDKDADAIAGAVNLVTKKAPEKRLLRLDSKGSYNSLENSADQYDFNFRYGERFWHNLLGVQITANAEKRIRSREYYDVDYNKNLNNWTDWEISDLALYYTDEIRKRQGAGLMLDFSTPDGGVIRFNNIYNFTERDYTEYYRSYSSTEMAEYEVRDRIREIKAINSYIQGDNYILGLNLNWGLSYAESQTENPFDYEVTFQEPSVTVGDSIIAGMRRVPVGFKGPLESLPDYAVNNFKKAYLYSAFYRTEEADEIDRNVFLNISKKYTLSSSISGEIKTGGKYKDKSRSRSNTELFAPYYNVNYCYYERLEDGSIVPKDFTGTAFENLETEGGKILTTNFLHETPRGRELFDLYRLYPLIDKNSMRELWELGENGVSDTLGSLPEYYENKEPNVHYYDINERITSGYLMNTFNFGQSVTWIAGLRVESEDNIYKSRYCPTELSGFPVPSGPILDTTATHKEIVWLPNTHLNVRVTDFMSIRGAAYRALARPDFNRRLANYVARRRGTFYEGNNFTVGNPGLRAAKAWNYELNTSFYGDKIGLFSVSTFYKDIEDMYHIMNGLVFEGTEVLDSLGIKFIPSYVKAGQPYALIYPYNSTKPTRVWGVEVEHQANMRFLPGLLKNIVLNYNFSFVKSETWIPSVRIDTSWVTVPGLPFPMPKYIYRVQEDKRKLEEQPEFFGNFAIGYDIKGFSIRLSMFHQGEFYRSYSPNRRSDLLQNSFTRWDLAIKQQITKGISLMLNINNLTNTKEGTSLVDRIDHRTDINNEETYGLTADLGLRIEF
ncbi:MAG: TonB-dependent receptor [Candidatus Neomarinimicrobiota bacterium]|jgi:TonB-dependent receptor